MIKNASPHRPVRLLLLIFACAWLLATPRWAAALQFNAATPIIAADQQALVLEDPQGKLTPEQALEQLPRFKPMADAGAPRIASHYWVLSELKSSLEADRELRIDAPGWYEVQSYLIDAADRWTVLKRSFQYHSSLSLLARINPYTTAATANSSAWPVFTLHHAETVRVLTHLVPNKNLQPATTTIQYIDHARYLELRRYGLHFEGLLSGILCALAVFGLASVYHNRDRTSVTYAVWIVFALLSSSSLTVHDGVRLFEFYLDLDTGYAGKVTYANMVLTSLAYCQSIGYVVFARNFLELKARMPRVYLLTNAYIVYTLAHLYVVYFVDHGLGVKALWLPLWAAIMLVLLTIYVCAYLRYREGLRVAKFFMLAMIPYIVFRFIFFLGLINVPSPFSLLPKSGFGLFIQNPNTAQAFGVCCEALIMALAVFSKNRWLQQELKDNIQAQAELMQNQNHLLEATVKERTRDLAASKAQVEQQHELLVDSIRYASRLQKAQLPRAQRLSGHFASFSVIWEPRDTIGGDLWWASAPDSQGRVTIAVADSTGHGVPGAMLSVLVSTSLERMFSINPELDPSSALMALDHALRIGLNQDHEHAESDDGCDAAMVRIDPRQRVIEFAGAKLGLMHMNGDGNVERIPPSRLSLGYQQPPSEPPALQRIGYGPGSSFVMVSDGFTDQIGGDGGVMRSYGYRRLMQVIESCRAQPAQVIADRMKESLRQWQGEQPRRDDLTAVVFSLA